LGYTQEEFLTSYYANINRQHEEVLSENPIALAIQHLLQQKVEWTGNATELLDTLEQIAPSLKINTNRREWAKAPQALSRRINEIKTNLAELGIEATKTDTRTWLLRHSGNTVNTADTVSTAQSKEKTDDDTLNDTIRNIREVFGNDIEVYDQP
jgi:hypothetical protein